MLFNKSKGGKGLIIASGCLLGIKMVIYLCMVASLHCLLLSPQCEFNINSMQSQSKLRSFALEVAVLRWGLEGNRNKSSHPSNS